MESSSISNIILKKKKTNIEDSDEISLFSIFELMYNKIVSDIEDNFYIKELKKLVKTTELDKANKKIKQLEEMLLKTNLVIVELESNIKATGDKLDNVIQTVINNNSSTGYIDINRISNYTQIQSNIKEENVIYYDIEAKCVKISFKDNNGNICFKNL